MAETEDPTVYVLPIKLLEPGDVIVVDFPKRQKVDRAEYDHWVAFLKRTFPQQRHIILAGGSSLRVMKHAKTGKETTDAGPERDDHAPAGIRPGTAASDLKA